ncbi:MAG: hypothetical protein ACOX5R_15765 [bacterium]|jgi:hypothetical protein
MKFCAGNRGTRLGRRRIFTARDDGMLFENQKYREFGLESTQVTDLKRLHNTMGVLVVAYSLVYLLGDYIHEQSYPGENASAAVEECFPDRSRTNLIGSVSVYQTEETIPACTADNSNLFSAITVLNFSIMCMKLKCSILSYTEELFNKEFT